MKKTPTERKRKTLKILAIILIITGVAAIAYPFFPMLKYRISEPEPYYPFPTQLKIDFKTGELPQIEEKDTGIPVNEQGIPLTNYLVIPKIGVYIEIVTSENESWALSIGAWHMPTTGNPATGSNMVISSHRFRYRPPNSKTFYLLDKMAIGDNFIIYWNQQEYDYAVTDIKIVEPNDASVLNQTEGHKVTLYTCTPLFTTDKRLVVIGELI